MRKYFLDNIRYSVVLLVVFYHVFYLFNSLDIISSVDIEGIRQLDVVLYVLYPWFMVCLFLVSGVSARYALKKLGDREFLKQRAKKILLPSIVLIFLLGWPVGMVTAQYADLFAGQAVPGFFKYLIYCLCGIGPLWFLHELMLATCVLLILRKLDGKERLWRLGEKTNFATLLLLVLAVWGSAQILNTPLVEIYRNGIYCFFFLLGYYVFSHERVQELVGRWAPMFLGMAVLLCAVYTAAYRGENYSSMQNLKSFPTNAYAWFGTLAVFGCGKSFCDRETAFTRYMRGRSFQYYVLHYPLMVLIAYGVDRWIDPPAWGMYALVLTGEAVLLPALVEAVYRLRPYLHKR